MIRTLARWLTRAIEISTTVQITQGRKLRALKRSNDPIEIILHESVTHSRKVAVDVLKRRKLGVHYTVDRDGSIEQHVPVTHYTIHGGAGHNRRSLGIEVINRYYGKHARDGQDVIPAVWAHRGSYIVPTLAQLESTWQLVDWLAGQFDSIPLEFPCIGDGSEIFRWRRDPDHKHPGIKAHHRWHHADGLFVEHYCALRARGFCAEDALDLTEDRAQSGARETALPGPKDSVS
jgi:hypothetical protein